MLKHMLKKIKKSVFNVVAVINKGKILAFIPKESVKDSKFDIVKDTLFIDFNEDKIAIKKELEELCFECSWEAAEINGVKGKLITGPNGNSIFLPCTGIYRGTRILNGADGLGAYLSASIGSYQPHAYSILFVWSDIASGYMGSDASRADGLAIRPVKE